MELPESREENQVLVVDIRAVLVEKPGLKPCWQSETMLCAEQNCLTS